MPRGEKIKPCPQCGATEDAMFSYGTHPVNPMQGQQPSEMEVEVWVCQQCGHVELNQVA
jgi:YgiT-type zinc finger domain-containing protein